MEEKKRVVNLTIVLFKESVTDYKQACDTVPGLTLVDIKDSFTFEGKIVYCRSKKTPPKWKSLIDELSESKVDLLDNTSNKAAIIVKIKDRFMAVVLGYGKSLLREDKFERNFGLKTALNIIAKDQLRSVQSAAIEDMVVSTQKQSSHRTTQDEFDLNASSDILRCVSGKPYNDIYGNTVSGKDTLSVAIPMDVEELGDKLTLFFDAFSDDRYKTIGFEWVDNINEIRDPERKKELDYYLCDCLLKKEYPNLFIAPPEMIDLEYVKGFCFSGIRKDINISDNYSLDPDFEEYLSKIERKNNQQILDTIRRHKLYVCDLEDRFHSLCNIYKAIVWQCNLDGKTYVLWNGTWYHAEQKFVEKVSAFIQKIPAAQVTLPNCPPLEKEEDYNIRAADSDSTFCLMDQEFVGPESGPQKIESCDIFTKGKQMIHVKMRKGSSQLSHLFAQGRVSAECFLSDEQFRHMVYEHVKGKLGNDVFDYKEVPEANEFEVVYAIIAERRFASVLKLPFFSQVNLMLACQSFERTRFKYSICFIEQE